MITTMLLLLMLTGIGLIWLAFTPRHSARETAAAVLVVAPLLALFVIAVAWSR